MAWAPSYATTAELAAYVRITDGLDDAQLDLAVAGASRAIDQTCRRQFGATAGLTARVYTAHVDAMTTRPVVDIDDLMSTTGLVVAVDTAGDGGFAGTVTLWAVGPVNAAADGVPWSQLFAGKASLVALPLTPGAVRVTATWGWSAVPETIKQACLMQASRLLARRDAPFGVSGSPESGSQMRLLAKVDPDVAVLLRPYTRRWSAV